MRGSNQNENRQAFHKKYKKLRGAGTIWKSLYEHFIETNTLDSYEIYSRYNKNSKLRFFASNVDTFLHIKVAVSVGK